MSESPIEFRQSCHESLGRRRRQEDYCAVWYPDHAESNQVAKPMLVVLADGMGGHVSGDTASELACKCYIESFTSGTGEIGARMVRALDVSNKAIGDAIGSNQMLEGMGCTLVAVYLDHDGMRWVSVGDSALLLYRQGSLHRLNADHSHGAILDRQAAAGIISVESATSDTRRRALYSALTGGSIQMRDLELNPHILYPGDWIVVASDGLLTLEGNEIASLIGKNNEQSPEAVTRRMIDEVEARNKPHQDNTTVVAIKITGDAQPLSNSDERPRRVDVGDIEKDTNSPTQIGPWRSRRSGWSILGNLFQRSWNDKHTKA